jgi:protein arginine N-methyltransferase 2
MDLFEAGFDTEWEDIKIPDLKEAGEWNGVRRPYWALEIYKLPSCKFMG